MHCFSGDVEIARRCLDLGLLISLAGPVTYPKRARAARRRAVRARRSARGRDGLPVPAAPALSRQAQRAGVPRDHGRARRRAARRAARRPGRAHDRERAGVLLALIEPRRVRCASSASTSAGGSIRRADPRSLNARARHAARRARCQRRRGHSRRRARRSALSRLLEGRDERGARGGGGALSDARAACRSRATGSRPSRARARTSAWTWARATACSCWSPITTRCPAAPAPTTTRPRVGILLHLHRAARRLALRRRCACGFSSPAAEELRLSRRPRTTCAT